MPSAALWGVLLALLMSSRRLLGWRGRSVPGVRPQRLWAAVSVRTSTTTSTDEQWTAAGNAGGRTLVIVESPAKAKTIQRFLGEDDYVVDFCMGHVRDLPSMARDVAPEYKKQMVLEAIKLNVADLGVDVANGFEPLYVPMAGKAEVLKRLKKLSGECSRILLATDEDREGEAISWHLLQVLQPKVPFKRAVFHEITESAIRESFQSPREIDMNLVHSQETRRILDRLAGYTISPVLWRYVATGLSAGRVQSCGLFLIAQREKKRWGFVESKYFSVRATLLADAAGQPSTSVVLPAKLAALDGKKVAGEADFDNTTGQIVAKLADSSVILDRAATIALLSWLSTGCTFAIANLESRKITKKPPRPFITSTLQQEGSRKLGLSPTRTMRVAQELYEAGFISYMRTDSPYLSATALGAAQGLVKRLFGEVTLDAAAGQPPTKPAAAASSNKGAKAQEGVKKPKGKKEEEAAGSAAPMNAQEAHEAIRPAESGEGTFKSPAETGLSGDNLRLYSLVYRRTLASIMQPSQSLTKTYTIHASAAAPASGSGSSSSAALHSHAVLRSSHTVRTFDGFQAAYVMDDTGAYKPSPVRETRDLEVGQAVRLAAEEEEDAAKMLVKAGAMEEGDDEGGEEGGVDGEEKESGGEEASEDALRLAGLVGTSHVTQPPSRHTEASFIQELEKIGVGRPSTYSKVFQVLRDRGYVLVDKQTLVPTITGMVVSEWMQRHFPALVEAKFTAAMETSLDLIARGQKDKLDFLRTFYLGSAAASDGEGGGKGGMTFQGTAAAKEGGGDDDLATTTGLGLLQAVERKLARAEIDHKESRSLVVPFLSEMGVLQLGRSGAFIESHANATELVLNEKEEANNRRWKLPESMQLDFRAITREAVARVMATETTMQGANMGFDPDGRPVLLRSGRFGRFLQIGADGEKNKTAHSLPRWVDHSVSLDEIVAFSKLPRTLGNHTAFEVPEGHALYHAPMVLEVTGGVLTAGIDQYPFRVALPEGLLVSQVTPELMMSLLTDPAAVLASQRLLGQTDDGEDVFVRRGRFGFYVRAGKIIAGLRKADPETLTLEEALVMLTTRGKPIGSKKKAKAAAKKVTKAKLKTRIKAAPRRKSAYQIYAGDRMKSGIKMAEVGSLWKALSEQDRREWVERAEQQQIPVAAEAAASDSGAAKAKKAKKSKAVASAAKKRSALAAAQLQVVSTAQKLANPERRMTGYNLFMKERMSLGVKFGEVATEWSSLGEAEKAAYKEMARGVGSVV